MAIYQQLLYSLTAMKQHRQFGDFHRLAIQCDFTPDSQLPPNLWLGCVWLTIAGSKVLDNDDSRLEQIGIALSALVDVASRTGRRSNHRLKSLNPRSALDLTLAAIYGEEEFQYPDEKDDIAGHDLLIPHGGPAFDGWEAILIEDNDKERYLWRRTGESSVLVRELPKGSLWAAAEAAKQWLSREAGHGKPLP